jgi:ABC-2 type transport system permease protein
MKKYWTIIKIAWQRALTYRLSVYAYRIGEMAWVLVMIIMWTVIYDKQQVIKGYTLNEMLTYVLIGKLIDVIVRNWLPAVIGNDIKNGLLSLFLVKPIKYIRYIFFREIGRISYAFFMSVLSQFALVIIFLNKIVLNSDIKYFCLMAVMIFLAFITELLLSYLIGITAFWTDEVDGIYYSFDKIKDFLAGQYFPLSLLPLIYVKISFLFPFAYSFFVPTQLYLKKIDIATGLKGIGVQLVWIILLYLIIKVVWKRGLRKYEGVGI